MIYLLVLLKIWIVCTQQYVLAEIRKNVYPGKTQIYNINVDTFTGILAR